MVRIDADVPVVMLFEALTAAGFELAGDDGSHVPVLRVSPRYAEHGECCGHFVPVFLRYQPSCAAAPLFPQRSHR